MLRNLILVVFIAFIAVFEAQAQGDSDVVWSKQTYPNACPAAKFTVDDNYLVTGVSGSKIQFWDILTGTLMKEYNQISVDNISLSNDGKLLSASSFSDKKYIYIWNLEKDTIFRKLTLDTEQIGKHDVRIPNNIITNDGRFILSVVGQSMPGNDYITTLYIWDVNSGEIIKKISLPKDTYKIEKSPNGQYFLLISQHNNINDPNNYLYLYEIGTWNLLKTITVNNDNYFLDAKFSPDNSKIAVAGTDGYIKFWKCPSGEFVKSISFINNGTSDLVSVNFSNDGNYIISYCPSTVLYFNTKIWNIQTSKNTYTYENNVGGEFSLSISNDNKYIGTGGGNGINILKARWNLTKVIDSIAEEETIYPNPTENILNIKYINPLNENIKISLLDITGNQIQNIFDSFQTLGEQIISLDISQYPLGIYFVRVNSKQFNKIYKIIKR